VFTTPGELEMLREAGINRLSIGAQTFDNDLLRMIGRDHGAIDVEAAVAAARSAGFDNLSIDLIFALPGQTLEGWSCTLDRALELGTDHISLYNLTIEEGTVFGERHRRGEIEPASSDLEADMYEVAIEKLCGAGLEHYEISNFALPGMASRHNQVYWRLEDYLGIGVGAHSCIRNVRFASGRNTLLHVRALESGRLPVETRETPDLRELLGEAMWLGLRLLRGVDLESIRRRFGADPRETFGEAISFLVSRGLLRMDGDLLSLTRAGLFLGNQVFCHFA
jgi:oxygen-independent coproporphyrinogen-3 oxidase